MAHVFIVNSNTFKFHLEFSFAGTGNGHKSYKFISEDINWFDNRPRGKKNKPCPHFTDGGSYSMIADIARVRKGDKILFYNVDDHKFYGVYKASSLFFFDDNDGNNYLYQQNSGMTKPLTFRILIEPDIVYSCGAYEYDCLDSLVGINKPYEMCWSLIYRKLTGARGCTAITDYEFDRLKNKIIQANNGKYLTGTNFTYNDNIVSSNSAKHYTGRQISIDILSRLKNRRNRGYAYESHLQAYIVENIDALSSTILDSNKGEIFWIGNEMICSMGERRIDIIVMQKIDNEITINLIELKDEEAYLGICDQLNKYEIWCKEYILPNYTDKGYTVSVKKIAIAKSFVSRKGLERKIMVEIGLQKVNVSFVVFDFDNNGNIVFSKRF